ncbi:MAG: hypothetical protein ACKO2K_04050 [Alphaproteobacteria bacterium]
MPPISGRPLLRSLAIASFALGLSAMSSSALAATWYVNALGASTNWWSDDTRNEFGGWLNGKTETIPFYFGPSTPAGTKQGDEAIDLQIGFGDFYPGSDGGLVRLWPTDSAPGKASIGTFERTSGFATTASLLAGFTAAYRMYVDPAPLPRTPVFRLNFAAPDGTVATFLYFHSPMSYDAWTTVDVDQDSAWSVFRSGVGWVDDSAADPKTMAQWAASHPEYFADGAAVFGVGFNIGSDQRQCYFGIDWLETSLLNGGDRIEFGTRGWTLQSVFVQDKPKAASDLWSASGDLVVESASALSSDVLADGLSVSIAASSAAGAFIGDSATFSAEECNGTSAANGIRCKNSAGSLARLAPRGGKPNEYRATIRVRRRDFDVPALDDTPLSVTITTSTALDAVASAIDCRSLLQGSKIECRN